MTRIREEDCIFVAQELLSVISGCVERLQFLVCLWEDLRVLSSPQTAELT